jgi:SM-20-related protein
MPGPEFFQQAGFFVVKDFLDEGTAADLRRAMRDAPTEKGYVVKEGGLDRLDETIRRVGASVLPKEIRAPLKARFRGLVPELQEFFQVQLADCESPQYLIYGPGDFFSPHSDGGPKGQNADARLRRISAVVFLNSESEEPQEDAYGEGRLTFHGLLDGPQWEHCAFPLKPNTGLLIAFPSEKIHEVTPVSHGRRFTVVTWFYAPSPAPPPAESPETEL